MIVYRTSDYSTFTATANMCKPVNCDNNQKQI